MEEQDNTTKAGGSGAQLDPHEASRLVKQYAANQKIAIKLTEEQLNAILAEWNDQDPRMPAEITFYVDERPAASLQVAGYRYRGDTCCV